MRTLSLPSSLAVRAFSVTALLLVGFSVHAQAVLFSSMGVGDVAHATNLTTNSGGQASTGALVPVSGYSATAVPITQLDANNGQAYFGNIYGGVLQVMPSTMTFTKMNAIINPQNTVILIGVHLTVSAQLYRFQRQGGSGQLVAVPGAACTFTDVSTLQAPNPVQTYENIVSVGELAVCSATFSATIPTGDSLMWLISMTASGISNNVSLVQTLPIDASISLATQAAQTLTFGAVPTVIVNGTGSVNATSATPNSGNVITYSTSSTDCSVTSTGVVSGINAGTNNCVIVATQAGNTNYTQGTATQTLSIGKATTTTALTTACMTTFVGNQPFTTTAGVTGSSPTGKVTFNQGASTLCSNVTLSSDSASCTTSALATLGTDAKASYNLTASYSGDAQNAASVSAALPITVLSASDVVYRNGFETETLSCPIE